MKTMNPVVVTEVKSTSDPEIFQVRLEQIIERDVTTQASLLSFTMEGHEKFSSNKTKRVAFQNFAKKKIEDLDIKVGKSLTDIPGIERAKIVVTETFEPRSWVNKTTGEMQYQNPKTAGQDGAVLTKDGKPIYRNLSLAINNMDFTDKFIQHDPVQKTGGTTDNLTELVDAKEEAPGLGDDLPY